MTNTTRCLICARPISTTNRDCVYCRVTCTCDSFARSHSRNRQRQSVHLSSCPISPDGYGLKEDVIKEAGY